MGFTDVFFWGGGGKSVDHISSNKGAIYHINNMDYLHPQGPMGVPGFQGNDGVPVSQK